MKEKIAVLFGGLSSEKEVSIRSADNVHRALLKKNHDAMKMELSENIVEDLRKNCITKVYLITHGSPGEDGTVQGLLELMNIPYTYSGVLASALAIDKKMAKRQFASIDLPVLPDVFFEQRDLINRGHFEGLIKSVKATTGFPVIVKPNKEGSSVGVKIVENEDELRNILPEHCRKYGSVLVEKYVKGKEVTVGVIEEKEGLTILPVLELVPKNSFYDYQAKYTKGMTELKVPAELSVTITEKVQKLAADAFNSLGCRGAGRVDFIIKDDEIWLLEVNTIPGMTETSDLPAEAMAMGINFEDLVEKILLGARIDRTGRKN